MASRLPGLCQGPRLSVPLGPLYVHVPQVQSTGWVCVLSEGLGRLTHQLHLTGKYNTQQDNYNLT